jgi:ATP-dependent Clp protease protease subunit
MFSLYDLIRFLPCPVHTIGLGKVQSAGVLLMAAGVKGQRLIGVNSSIMMHPLSGGAHGNIFELDGTVKEAQRKQRLMIDALRSETKMTRSRVRKIMHAGRDYYVTAADAIELGIADRLIGVPSRG